MTFKTEQEKFWAGEFGENYISRNQGPELLASNLAFFSKALAKANGLQSIIEFGANIGMNIKALKILFPNQDQFAIEINAKAADELETIIPSSHVFRDSILEFSNDKKFDLALIKGVLIHINPDELPKVYEKLYNSASRYVLVCEYYNPSPVTIDYRGQTDRLFKRDFAGEILKAYPDLQLIDYGFAYRGDPNFPQDDITWFLMQKAG
jgi:pseudaminic acid biosynthesis-associated methylase